ncbi:MAG: two-component regulator propeller domain-containing protein [Breznakibacter sp.]
MKPNLFIFLAFWVHSLIGAPYSHDYSFSYLNTSNGLSQNEVTSIVKDKYGFMWFGTRGGLNRFDGYLFRHFKPMADSENALTGPSIERLALDNCGNILIGSKTGGLCTYDISRELFKIPDFRNRLPKRIISCLEDRDKNLWIGSWSSGLWHYDSVHDTLINVIKETKVSTILQTSDGVVWCGTSEGLIKINKGVVSNVLSFEGSELTEMIIDKDKPVLWLVGWKTHLVRFDYRNGTFSQFKVDGPSVGVRDSYSIAQDEQGDLFVGTWGQGLFRFDVNRHEFLKICIAPENSSRSKMDFDIVLDIFQDAKGDFWIGTDGGGVVRLFKRSHFNIMNIRTLQEVLRCHVNAIFIDSRKRRWLGTKGDGLFVSADNGLFSKVEFLNNDPLFGMDGIVVKKIIEDPSGNVWVSLDEGLFVVQGSGVDRYKMKRAAVFFDSPDLQGIEKVQDLFFDHSDLWIGTQQKGLFLFRREGLVYREHKNYNSQNRQCFLPENRVTSVLKNKNDLWVATYQGLFKLNALDSTLVPLDRFLPDGQKVLSGIVLNTFVDSRNDIWFGTPCSLNRLQKDGEKYSFTDFTTADGLMDDYVNAVLEDSKGRIWISTNAGLSSLEPKNGEILNYDTSDGVGAVNFTESACYKSINGTLFFGSYEGVTYFNPDEITLNESMPEIVFTNFKIMNNDVKVSEDGLIKKSINELDEVELTYREREFSFEFAALDFKAPHKNQYAYKLEGVDSDWKKIGSRHYLSFSNLSPGVYTLRIRGTNSNGVWSNQTRNLRIVVLTPFWKTWYAIVLYGMVILAVIYLIIRNKLKQEHLFGQIELERLRAEKEHELTEYKLSFFTNVSHELRTPLTLISAPVNELLSSELSGVPAPLLRDRLLLVKKNSDRLYNLINQLLEFRKIDAGKVRLEVTCSDIVPFVDELLAKFKELAVLGNIEFKCSVVPHSVEVCFDEERMEVILSNLLANALKYSGKPGLVQFELDVDSDHFVIKVSNSGKGIAKEELPYLFDRFYQARGSNSMGNSGIGLALVKSYVDLHKGTIEVFSAPNETTTFVLKFKLGTSHFCPNEVLFNDEVQKRIDPVFVQPIEVKAAVRSINSKGRGSRIVVVEDHDEVRNYLMDLLGSCYEVHAFNDGLAGYDAIVEHKPALVISDVMMPGMDGFELCAKVKSNDTLVHIPVLLLTAKGLPEDELFGTKSGADAYITKPFNPDLLLEKVRQLISVREQLSHKYAQQIKLEGSDIEVDDSDADFLKQAIKLIDQHIADPGFDSDKLAVALAMSSSTFYRRIKKITGQTPRDFMVGIKMKRAAQYLAQTNYTVFEIIEKLGYQETKTFRRNFREVFDLSPSEYRSQYQQ